MTQMQNAQSVALQLEKVRDKLPLLYERDDILLTMIQQRGDVERVSSRNMRLPLQIRPGGKAGLANMDGGDLGRGSGTVYDVAQVTPVFFRHAVEITKLVEYASNAPEKAIENTAKREVKNAMAQFRAFLDKVMQTNGNGVLGNVGSITTTGLPAGVAVQFGMAKPPGAQLFYYNQTVQVYDPTLTTNRGSANVLLVDPFNSLLQVTEADSPRLHAALDRLLDSDSDEEPEEAEDEEPEEDAAEKNEKHEKVHVPSLDEFQSSLDEILALDSSDSCRIIAMDSGSDLQLGNPEENTLAAVHKLPVRFNVNRPAKAPWFHGMMSWISKYPRDAKIKDLDQPALHKLLHELRTAA